MTSVSASVPTSAFRSDIQMSPELFDELTTAVQMIQEIQNIVGSNFATKGGANYLENYNPLQDDGFKGIFTPGIGQTIFGSGLILEQFVTDDSLPTRMCTSIGGFVIGTFTNSGGKKIQAYREAFNLIKDKFHLRLNTPLIKGDGDTISDIGPFYSINHPKFPNIGTSPVLTKTEDYIPFDVCIRLWNEFRTLYAV
jgi:hypothetical protein